MMPTQAAEHPQTEVVSLPLRPALPWLHPPPSPTSCLGHTLNNHSPQGCREKSAWPKAVSFILPVKPLSEGRHAVGWLAAAGLLSARWAGPAASSGDGEHPPGLGELPPPLAGGRTQRREQSPPKPSYAGTWHPGTATQH